MTDDPPRSDDDTGAAPHVDSVDAFEKLTASDGTVLVDFYADWCGPCQLMAPTVDDLASESEATVVKLDVEAVPQVAAAYDVKSIPSFVVFEDGTPTERLVGMQEKEALRAVIE